MSTAIGSMDDPKQKEQPFSHSPHQMYKVRGYRNILVTQPYSLLTSGKQYKQIMQREKTESTTKTIEKT